MARNQGSFTVVVKRSRRVMEKGARVGAATVAATSEMPALPGWPAAASSGGTAPRDASHVGSGADGTQARRAADKLFAPRKAVGPRILPASGKASVPIERMEPDPVDEPVAVFHAADDRSATTKMEPKALAAQTAAREATAEAIASAPARRAKRQAGRSAFPPGQGWREVLPESCWPEEMRRIARRTRRRAARRAAGRDEPVQ